MQDPKAHVRSISRGRAPRAALENGFAASFPDGVLARRRRATERGVRSSAEKSGRVTRSTPPCSGSRSTRRALRSRSDLFFEKSRGDCAGGLMQDSGRRLTDVDADRREAGSDLDRHAPTAWTTSVYTGFGRTFRCCTASARSKARWLFSRRSRRRLRHRLAIVISRLHSRSRGDQ